MTPFTLSANDAFRNQNVHIPGEPIGGARGAQHKAAKVIHGSNFRRLRMNPRLAVRSEQKTTRFLVVNDLAGYAIPGQRAAELH